MHHPKFITTFPNQVREIENTWITLNDGCKLATRIWLPKNGEQKPVPAVLEYLPYRKRDGTAVRDELTFPYFAGHGIAGVRVDMRGNGESDGVMWDEYLKQEQDDALEVIEWIAEQSWCNGNVGMMGISWGGFNGLQVAARQPPALKAIITLCSTDDRYADDIHFKGGAMLMENLGWASTMFCFSSRPPDPVLAGDRWREIWMQRLNNTPLLIKNWLEHQHRDEFWKHGSVCEDFSAIKVPVYAIGGWGDAYSNAVPRMMTGLQGPARGLTGPWIHKYPHFATPRPAVGFLQDALKWWDHWLNETPTDVMEKPLYQVYMMDSVLPEASYETRVGRWIGESEWPSPNVRTRILYLNRNGLGEQPAESTQATLCSPQDTGTACGEYCAMWQGPEGPTDQRRDDSGSLTFDSGPLSEACEIFGAPVVELEIALDRPQGNIAVRLCDVWPSGESTRITYGILNLCHRESHEHPEALEPGKKFRIRIQLDDIAYRVKPGNRIRVALSTAYWPMIWPPPEIVTATVSTGLSVLELPVRRTRTDNLPEFPEAESAQLLATKTLREASNRRTVEYDLGSGETVVRLNDDYGKYENLQHGLISGLHARETHHIHKDDPSTCSSHIHWTATVERGDWRTRTETETTLSCDRDYFYINAKLEAFENEGKVFENTWKEKVERNLI